MSQVFISYRRDGGEALAQLLFDRLSGLGFSVFYDIESLKSGPFDTGIYRKIEDCEDFLLVLPPMALDRCIYDDDWVRNEIRHALKLKKNIVPVMMRGFVFPPDLPDDISAVSKSNGVSFESMEYLNAKIEKLVSMLISTPSGVPSAAVKVSAPSATAAHIPTIISNVCSIGSNDASDCWPNGKCSSVISLDDFTVVYFQSTIINVPRGLTELTQEMKIYNSSNRLIFFDSTAYPWQDDWDRISKGWIIRGADGSTVPTGTYRAELRANDSDTFVYHFEITSRAERRKNLLSRLFKRF